MEAFEALRCFFKEVFPLFSFLFSDFIGFWFFLQSPCILLLLSSLKIYQYDCRRGIKPNWIHTMIIPGVLSISPVRHLMRPNFSDRSYKTEFLKKNSIGWFLLGHTKHSAKKQLRCTKREGLKLIAKGWSVKRIRSNKKIGNLSDFLCTDQVVWGWAVSEIVKI